MPRETAAVTVDRVGLAAAAHKPAEWTGYRERGSLALLRFMAFLSMRLGRKVSRIPL